MQQATKTMSIAVAALPLVILTGTLPPAKVGEIYLAILTANQGTPPYAWSLAAGSTLPPGLVMSQYLDDDGNPTGQAVISGTPTAPGNFSFNVVVSDSA